jgi:hypothetical protein
VLEPRPESWAIRGRARAIVYSRSGDLMDPPASELAPYLTAGGVGSASTFVLTANTGTSRNAQSLVLMIEYQDFTAVFTGDADSERREKVP